MPDSADGPIPLVGIHALLHRLKVSGALGRPLYSHRLSEAEFLALQRDLQRALRRAQLDQLDNIQAAGLCLFGSEWWRRSFTGGAWSWENLLRPLGVTLPGSVTILYPSIRKGLAFLGRRVRVVGNRNVFLATLAIEGGLPLQLVQRDGQWLRRYLRAVLEQHQLFHQTVSAVQLARELHTYLPRTLQHEEIYWLAGEIISQIFERAPGWRERLPLALDNTAAEDLIRGLEVDADTLREGRAVRLRIATFLELRGQGATLFRAVELPLRLEQPQLRGILDTEDRQPARQSDVLAARMQLVAEEEDGACTAVAVLTKLFEQDGYAVDTARARGYQRLSASGRLSLSLRTGDGPRQRLLIPGGEALGDLPWVFAPTADPSAPLRLLAEGGVRTRQETVLVAIPPDAVLVGAPGAKIEEAGDLHLAHPPHRKLLRLTGAAKVLCDVADCAIHTAAPEDITEQHTLRGPRLELTPSLVYLGMPRLCACREDQPWVQVAAREIQTSAPLGLVRLRRVAQGGVRYQTWIVVLPATTVMTVRPRVNEGTIEISGLEGARVGVVPEPGLKAQVAYDQRSDRHTLTLSTAGPPPILIKLALSWGDQEAVLIELPFPAAGAWFLGRDGAPLPDGAKVSLAELPNIKLSALATSGDLTLQAMRDLFGGSRNPELRTDLRTPRTLVGPVPLTGQRLMLSLGLHGDRVAPYLSASIEHDTPVILSALLAGRSVRRLLVLPYSGRLSEASDAPGKAVAQRNDGSPIADPPAMEALPFWDPDRALPLARDGEGGLIPQPLEPGPWLIFARSQSSLRPLKRVIPPLPDQAASPAGTLRAACAASKRPERRALLATWLQALAVDPTHPEWPLLLATVKQLHSLPALYFDVLRDLVLCPDAVALAALLVDSADFAVLFHGLESLPFSFATLPLASWERAARRLLEAQRQQLALAGLTLADDAEGLGNLLERAPRSLRGLRVAAQLVEHRVLRRRALSTVAEVKQRELTRLKEAVQALFRAHAHDQWPQWSWSGEINQLRPRLPGDLGRLLAGAGPLAELPYREPVVAAPIIAALASATGEALLPRSLFHLRMLGQFDPLWFETAHEIMLGYAVARLRAEGVL